VRRDILRRVAGSERSVAELAASYDMSLEAVSKHVRVLIDAELVDQRKLGRERRCAFNPRPLRGAAEVIEFFESFWSGRLDDLESYLTGGATPRPRRPQKRRRR
jgi:DNA-binding transcriptional ArsR family regulator